MKTYRLRWNDITTIYGWVEATSKEDAMQKLLNGDVVDCKTMEGRWDGEGVDIEEEE